MPRSRTEPIATTGKDEADYRLLVEQAVDGIFVSDAAGRYLDVNAAGCRMLGYERHEILGLTILDVIAEEEGGRLAGEVARLDGGGIVRSDWRFRRKNGSRFMGEVVARKLPDGRLQAILRDISERKRIEDDLRLSRHALQAALDVADMAAWGWDETARIKMWTPATKAIFGLRPDDEMTRERFVRMLHPDDVQRYHTAWSAALDPNGPRVYQLEYRIRRADDGAERWISSKASVDFEGDRPARFMGAMRDITDERRAAEALRESEARLRFALKSANAAAWQWNVGTDEIIWSSQDLAIYGFDPAIKAPGFAAFFKIVHPDDRAALESQIADVAAGRVREYSAEFRIVRASGEVRWLAGLGKMQFDPDGKPVRLSGINLDITERKRDAEQLAAAKQMLDAHMDNSPLAVIEFDPAFRIVRWSAEAERMFGWPAAEVIGRSIPELRWVHDDDAERVRHVTVEMLAGRKPRNLIVNRNYRADGRIADCEWYNSAIYDTQGRLVSILSQVLDVTQRNRGAANLRFLASFGEALSRCASIEDIGPVAAQAVRQHFATSCCILAEIDERQRQATVIYEDCASSEPASLLLDVYDVMDYYTPDEASTLARGQPVAIDDVRPGPRDAAAAARWEALGVRALITAPHVSGGRWRFVLCVTGREPSAWRPDEIELLMDLASRTYLRLERARAEEAVRESEQRLGVIVNTAVDAILVIDADGIVQSANPATTRIFGFSSDEVVSRNVNMLIPDSYRQAHEGAVQALRGSGAGSAVRATNREVYGLRKDGSTFPAELSIVEWRFRGAQYFTGIVRDISERRRREEQVQLLLREVNHRAKNMLGVVQAIAWQTSASNPADFIDRFSERIQALAANQDLLVKSEWQGIAINDLVRAQLAHFSGLVGSRITLSGPPLWVTSEAAQPLAMALHELSTNAGKYGALSTPDGCVAICWRVAAEHEQDIFHISWTESGGPPVAVPTRVGFGTTVIRQMPEAQLNARVSLDYAPQGLCWVLACPAGRVLDTSRSAPVVGAEAAA